MPKTTKARLSKCTLPLPANYRPTDTLKFHARDRDGLAEIVVGNKITKGLMWNGAAALAQIELGERAAQCSMVVDTPGKISAADCEALMRRLLALHIEIADFEAAMSTHPELGATIRAQTGLRLPMAATPYEALVWAITGQQINLGVALQLRHRLIALAGQVHSSGIACHPDAAAVARLSADQLGQAKFSRAKAEAILTVSSMVCSGELPLDAWLAEPLRADEIQSRLLAIRGIGPWTVNYTMLRGYGWADGSLHGDVAVRNSLQEILARSDRIAIKDAEAWLAPFAPWRSLVAAHLWARLAKKAGAAGEA